MFLKAWEALGRYRMREVPFRTWLYRIAHNTLIDHYRTAKEAVPRMNSSNHMLGQRWSGRGR